MPDSDVSSMHSTVDSHGFFRASGDPAHPLNSNEQFSRSVISSPLAASAGQSSLSCSNETSLVHSIKSDLSTSVHQNIRRDDEEVALTEHDYIGLSEAAASSGSKTLVLRSGMRESQGPIPDLNLGETELRLGPPKPDLLSVSDPPSGASSFTVGGKETISSLHDEERHSFAACAEQISCRGEGLVPGFRDGVAADRPQSALKRGFQEVICSRFAEQSSSRSLTMSGDAALNRAAADSEAKHMRNHFLPPAYPWAATASSTPMDLDHSGAPVQSFSSAVSLAERHQKYKPSGQAGVKDSDANPWGMYGKIVPTEDCYGMKAAPDAQDVPGEESENAPASCSPVVGWPPVQSFRNKALAAQPQSKPSHESQVLSPAVTPPAIVSGNASVDSFFVKVYMDGITIGRKVDLNSSNSYEKLFLVLEDMFRRFMLGNGRTQASLSGSTALVKEKRERTFLHGSEYVLTYEDKDGDLMLVGDVPWSMFICSVRRLRIMKGSDAIGLAPKACERVKITNKHC